MFYKLPAVNARNLKALLPELKELKITLWKTSKCHFPVSINNEFTITKYPKK